MTVTVTCTVCAQQLYASSPIKGDRHRANAHAKALRLAQEHAVATSHAVEIADGSSVGVVACRCARCGEPTPGSAYGICPGCLFERLEAT